MSQELIINGVSLVSERVIFQNCMHDIFVKANKEYDKPFFRLVEKTTDILTKYYEGVSSHDIPPIIEVVICENNFSFKPYEEVRNG